MGINGRSVHLFQSIDSIGRHVDGKPGATKAGPLMTKQIVVKLVLSLICPLVLVGCRSEIHSGPRDGGGVFVALGSLPGYSASDAAAVSADGRVVVGTATSSAGFKQAFRWNATEGIVGLGVLAGGMASSGQGVSADGSVVIGTADGGTPLSLFAFRWTRSEGLVPIPGLRASGHCVAGAVSGAGDQIVGTCLEVASEAFRWSDREGTIGLGRFGTGSNATSGATAISADGRVVGGAGHPVLIGAIVWDGDRPIIVGNPPGDSSGAITGLSTDGSVAVGVSVDGNHRTRAFRWRRNTGIEPLPRADAFIATFAAGVSGDARRTVGWATTSEGERAVLWDGADYVRTLTELLCSESREAIRDWRNLRARAISEDGRTIVGHGTSPAGTQEAWLVTLGD